jgi:plastocyanin
MTRKSLMNAVGAVRGSRRASVRVVLLVGAAVATLAMVPRLAGDARTAGSDPVREIQVVARGMTFYIDGQAEPNPTLHARPGERIQIVLRNADAGMSHDFAIRSWRISTRLLKGRGEDRIEFTVPETRGAHVYTCTPHAEMMSGTILVN